MKTPNAFDRFMCRLVFLTGVALLLGTIYVCLTFPVLGHHGPACLCDDCIDRLDQDPERIEYLEGKR